jgi:hypothetical protein
LDRQERGKKQNTSQQLPASKENQQDVDVDVGVG